MTRDCRLPNLASLTVSGTVCGNVGRAMRHAAGWAAVVLVAGAAAAQAVTVERFTPEGVVKPVRQATVLFSAPMVPFGDLRDVAPPFTVECPVPGKGRWVDARTWAYDFDRDLPGGLRCVFTARPDLASHAGEAFTGETQFALSTGGPAIATSVPSDGTERIDEQQAFVLSLDGEATTESILAHTGFEVDGVAERIGVDLIEGADRDAVVAGLPTWLKPDAPFVVVKARQTFPNETKIHLVWGAGIAGPSGVATERGPAARFRDAAALHPRGRAASARTPRPTAPRSRPSGSCSPRR